MNGMRQMLDAAFLLDWARRTVQRAEQGQLVNREELRRARAVVAAWRQQSKAGR